MHVCAHAPKPPDRRFKMLPAWALHSCWHAPYTQHPSGDWDAASIRAMMDAAPCKRRRPLASLHDPHDSRTHCHMYAYDSHARLAWMQAPRYVCADTASCGHVAHVWRIKRLSLPPMEIYIQRPGQLVHTRSPGVCQARAGGIQLL